MNSRFRIICSAPINTDFPFGYASSQLKSFDLRSMKILIFSTFSGQKRGKINILMLLCIFLELLLFLVQHPANYSNIRNIVF